MRMVNLRHKRAGFASIMLFVAMVLAGAGIVGGLLNTTWIDKARRGDFDRDVILWANTRELNNPEKMPEAYQDSVATVIWLDFIRNNVTPMTNMVDFGRDVRRWNTNTKRFAREDAARTIQESGVAMNQENGYRKFMRKSRDDNTDITWVYPEIDKIPDETLHSGLRLREDALKVFIADSNKTRRFYPEEYLSTRSEIAKYYSDSHKETQDINFLMPFSIQ